MISFASTGTELTRFKKGTLPKLALVVLLFIPLIYGALYLWAFWAPTDEMKNLPVALVNDDRGTTLSDGTVLHAGDDVAEKLIDGADLKWVPVSAEQAREGVAEGTYYFSVSIPEDFSEAAGSVSGDAPEQAKIDVTYNDSNNFLASTLGKSAMTMVRDAVAEQISASTAETMLVGVNTLADGIRDAADGSGRLSEGAETLDEGAGQLVVGLGTLADGSALLSEGAGTLSGGVQTLSSGAGQLADGTRTLAGGAGTVAEGTRTLAGGLGQAAEGSAALSEGATSLASGARELAQGTGTLNAGLQQLLSQVGALGSGSAQLASGTGDLSEAFSERLVPGAGSLATASSDLAAFARANPTATAAQLQEKLDQLSAGAQALQGGVGAAQAGVQKLDAGVRELGSSAPALVDGVQRLAQGAEAVDGGAQRLTAGADALEGGAGTLSGKLAEAAPGARALAAGAQDLSSGAGTLAQKTGELSQGAQRLEGGAATLAEKTGELAAGAGTAANGARDLSDGTRQLAEGSEELSSKLGEGAEEAPSYSDSEIATMTDVVASPVGLAEANDNEARSFGEGFAPFFLALATFVGALITWLILRALPTRALASRTSGLRAALTGFLPAAAIGLGQVIIMMLVLVYGIGLEPVYWLGTAAFVYLTTLAFLALQQMFIVLFGSATGRVISLVLLMIQLSSSGGTYPVETTPAFFQVMHPFMPATYVVNGLRQLITGGIDERFFIALAYMIGLLVISFGISAIAAGRQKVWTLKRLVPELAI